ncbi:MAG TPA: heme-binding protein [Stellaceae bacterium]|nr:heme-binding protein [Stellaceae bacterium]
MKVRLWISAFAGAAFFAAPALAQQASAPPSAPPAYGLPITLAQAKRVMAGAEAEARKSPSPVAIYIVEPSGELVMMERMDNTQYGSVALAQRKAETAARFKRSTQALQDRVQANVYVLALGGTAIGGGLPILSGGKVIGAIGVSGSPGSAQDEKVAQAGIDELEKKK